MCGGEAELKDEQLNRSKSRSRLSAAPRPAPGTAGRRLEGPLGTRVGLVCAALLFTTQLPELCR